VTSVATAASVSPDAVAAPVTRVAFATERAHELV
jgi:hypothetical protein